MIEKTEMQNISTIKFESDIEKNNFKRKNFHCKNVIYFFISEYGWFLVICIIISISFIFPYHHPPRTYYSKTPKEPWDSEYTPKIFLHLTDIHISFYLGSRTNRSTKYFDDFLQYNPNLILSTGDTVDNFEDKNFPKVGSQWPADWGIYYEKIKKNISKFKVIDVAGNHDLFAVDSLFSENNNFLDYSFSFNRNNVKTFDNFIVKKIRLFNETFILFNEYLFPTTHPPYGVAPHPTKHMLDLLEKAVDSSGDCFILNHYQVDRNWFITSSKGNTYRDIVSKKNVKAIFTGHAHPLKTMIIHHGQGAVEYCLTTPFIGKAQGLITIDNGQLVYNSVVIKKRGRRPLFFMTYPVPNDQLSSHHTFDYNSSEIRIISYAGKNVTLQVSGDIFGTMKFKKKLPNSADLYTFPINLPYGMYTINVKGDGCDITRSFVIGRKFKGHKELAVAYVRSLLILRFCSIPIFIGIVIIIFPTRANIKLAKNVENKIEDYSKIKSISIFKYILFIINLVFLGPFIIRERYKLINLSTKIYIIVFTIYPLIFPNNIFKPFYGVYGYSFLCFVVIGKRIQFDEWALQITFAYYLSVVLIHVIYLGGLKYYSHNKHRKMIYAINLSLVFLFWGGGLYLNIGFIGETISWPYLFLTPTFVIIPMILKYIIFFNTYIDKETK